ncbi:MAG: hypothetical protein AB1679_01435 [Actinomycetota bacterium]
MANTLKDVTLAELVARHLGAAQHLDRRLAVGSDPDSGAARH